MSQLLEIAQALEDSSLAIALHESLFAYPLLEGTHLLGLALSVGLLAIIDLRLLGVVFTTIPKQALLFALRPWMLWGFVVTFVTGVVLFATSATSHIQSPAFLCKLVFIVFAGINALWFELRVVRRWSKNETDAGRFLLREKWAGSISLLLWLLVIVTGRLIAYYPGAPV